MKSEIYESACEKSMKMLRRRGRRNKHGNGYGRVVSRGECYVCAPRSRDACSPIINRKRVCSWDENGRMRWNDSETIFLSTCLLATMPRKTLTVTSASS